MHLIQICPASDGFFEKNISKFPSLKFLELPYFAQHERNFCDMIDYHLFLFKLWDLQLLPSFGFSLISCIVIRLYSHFLDFAQCPAHKKNLDFYKIGDFLFFFICSRLVSILQVINYGCKEQYWI